MSDALIIPVDSSQVEKGKRSLADLATQGKKTEQAIDGLGKSSKDATNRISAIGTAATVAKAALASFGLFTLASLVKESVTLASRYQELGIVMKVVGQNAGFTSTQLNAQELALRKTGISMLESRSNITKLIAANIDLSKSTQLARLAQDAAVIGGINSSEAFARLTTGIQTAQVETLRTLGLNVSFEASYKKLADTLGKTSNDLTEFEKTQARVNAVLALAPTIAGAYEASLDNAGKQIRSSTRYIEDLKVQLGSTFNEALTVAVLAFTSSLKDANGEVSELAQSGQLKKWGEGVLDIMAFVADAVRSVGTVFQLTGSRIAEFIALRSNGIDTFLGGGMSAGIKQAAEDERAQLIQSTSAFRDALAERRKALSEKKPIDKILEQGLADAGANETFLRREAEANLKRQQEAADAAKRAGKARESQINSIRASLALLQQENKLIAQGIPAEDARTIARLKAQGAADKLIVSMLNAQNTNDALVESEKQRLEIIEGTKKALESQVSVNQQHISSIYEAIVASEAEVENFGKLPSEIERTTIARLEEIKAVALANGGSLESVKNIQLEIEARKKLIKSLAGKEILEANKKANDERVKQAQKAADDTAKAYEKMSDDINKSLTDALLRGFESGKGFAKNFRDTLINMFKTLILQPTISAILKPLTDGVSGILSKGLGGLTGGASGGGLFGSASNLLSVGKSIYSGFSGALSSNIGGLVANFAPQLGSSIAGTALGSFAGQGATIAGSATGLGSLTTGIGSLGSAISTALPYIGLAITAFSVFKSVFGGKKKIPRFSTLRAGEYADGVFTGRSNGQQYKSLGAEKQIDSLSETFSRTLGGFLKGFGLNDSISTTASLFKKRKASYGNFSATFAGGTVYAGEQGKAKNVQQTFEKLVETVLGTTLVQAIQQSKAAEGIKALFNGLTDKTQVVNMINASLTLQEAQKELADKYGLTVDLAGKVSVASGEAGDALAGFVNSLSGVALSGRTVGTQLIKNRDKLFTDFNTVFGDVLTEAVLSTVSKQVPIAATASKSAALGFGGFGRLPQANGLAGILGQLKAPAVQQFKTVTEQVTTFVDRIVSRNLQLPRTIADYDTLLKNIDKTTLSGQKMFAEVFALRGEFVAFINAVDGLKGNVRGALFGLVSDAEKQGMLNDDLAKLFGSLNRAVPQSEQELIALGRSIDYGTQAGLDLAAVFPSLVSAFKEAQNGIESLVKSLRDESGFKTLYDFNFYKGIASNYGAEFANRLIDGAAVTYGASNNTSANLPLNIAPNNNTTISTSDPNMLNAITLLTNTVNTLKAEIISIKTNTKSSADTLLRVSPDGNSIQTKVAA